MYSKIKIAGHPVHPMLVAFPVACYTGTLGIRKHAAGNEDTREPQHGHATAAELTRESCDRANRTAHDHA